MTNLILPENKPEKPMEIDFNAYSHFKVSNNRVMVKVIPIDFSKNEAGIVLSSKDGPKSNTMDPVYGVICSVGEGMIKADGGFIKPNYQVGDVVAFTNASGADYKLFRGAVGSNKFETVRIVDLPSIHLVDNSLKSDSVNPIYTDITK